MDQRPAVPQPQSAGGAPQSNSPTVPTALLLATLLLSAIAAVLAIACYLRQGDLGRRITTLEHRAKADDAERLLDAMGLTLDRIDKDLQAPAKAPRPYAEPAREDPEARRAEAARNLEAIGRALEEYARLQDGFEALERLPGNDDTFVCPDDSPPDEEAPQEPKKESSP